MSDSAAGSPPSQPMPGTRPASRFPVRDLAAISAWFLALSAIYWAAVWIVVGRPGFSIDDAFIHLQFARNLLETGQMAFNQGVPSSGNTAPAFPALLTACYLLVKDWYVASFLLGAVCSLGTGWAAYVIVRSWNCPADIARWAGILTVVASPTVTQAYSGMEPPVYCLVVLGGLWIYGKGSGKSRLLGSSVLALSIWLRPEFLMILPLITLERLITEYGKEGRWFRRWFAEVIPITCVWLVVVGGYGVYHWFQDRHFVPSTFDAKVLGQYINKPEWLDGLPAAVEKGNWFYALLSIGFWPLLTAAMAVLGIATICLPVVGGLARAVKVLWSQGGPGFAGRRLAILLLVGYPLIRGIVEPMALIWFQQQRYYAHLTPLAILAVLAAVPHTGTVVQLGKWNWRGVSVGVQRRRTIAWGMVGTLLMGTLAVLAVDNINDMQVEMAHWLQANTSEGDVIATNDIGAIGFITRRTILDTVGLVEPAIVDYYLEHGSVRGYITQRDVAFCVLFPNWYDFTDREDLLEKVHSVSLNMNVVCGGKELVAYRPKWTSAETGQGPD